jgi:hypothetical protein
MILVDLGHRWPKSTRIMVGHWLAGQQTASTGAQTVRTNVSQVGSGAAAVEPPEAAPG